MKNSIIITILISIIAVNGVIADLHQDLEDFIAALPNQRLIEILTEYTNTSPAVNNIVILLKSDESMTLLDEIYTLMKTREVMLWIGAHGVNVESYYLRLKTFITNLPTGTGTGDATLEECLLEIETSVDALGLILLVETRPNLTSLFLLCSGPDTEGAVKIILQLPNFISFTGKLAEQGLDVQKYIDLLCEIFGWII